jgi:RNA polymerase sigma factor (sigma-70 family)
MTNATIGPLKECLGRASDGQLLARFRERRDPAAFAALVRRHGPMVLAACRRVLGDGPDADDAFQATFLALMRRAETIRQGQSVAGWLYAVARRAAVQSLRAARRRRRHELEVPERAPADAPARDLSWREAVAVLYEELDRLPERYRLPLLVCGLEGKGRDEAAAQLGWSAGSLKGRLERGRQLLRDRLKRRGVELPAGLVVLLAGTAVPAALAGSTARLAEGAAPSPAAALLAQSVAGSSSRLVRTAALVLIALAAGGVAISAVGQAVPDTGVRHSLTYEDPSGKPAAIAVAGRVLDPDGRPRADVPVYLGGFDTEGPAPARPTPRAVTGADGRFAFRFDPAEFTEPPGRVEPWRFAQVVAVADGFGPAWAHADRALSGELTLRLARDDVPITGRVLTLEGRPVAGARVRLRGLQDWHDADRLTAYLKALAAGTAAPDADGWLSRVPGRDDGWTADADGRFRLTGLGRDRTVTLAVSGPGVAAQSVAVVTRPGPVVVGKPNQYRPEPAKVYGAAFDLAVPPGRSVIGTVRDDATGQPVPGMLVSNGDTFAAVRTDAAGRFELPAQAKSKEYGLYVRRAPDGPPYLPASFEVADTAGLGPVPAELSVRRGVPVRVRVTDAATGRPETGQVRYLPLYPNRHAPKNLFTPMISFTPRGDGWSRGVVLPGPGAVCVWREGGRYRSPRVDQKAFFHLDTMPADEKRFPANENLWGAEPHPSPFPQGQFEAIRLIDPKPDAAELALELTLDPGRVVTVAFRDADGQPLSGVSVWGTHGHSEWGPPLAGAGLPVSGLDPTHPRLLQFRHEGRKLAGAVELRGDEAGPVAVTLRPWGTVTGRLVDLLGKPQPGHGLAAGHPPKGREGQALPLPGEARTDEQGRFRIEGLVPEREYSLRVSKYLNEVGMFVGVGRFGAVVNVKPGETRDLGDVRVWPFE